MASAIVYAGFTGRLESCFNNRYRACYSGEGGVAICECYGSHASPFGSEPVDVSAAAGNYTQLITSSVVKSFKSTKIDGGLCAAGAGPIDEVGNSIKLELFTGWNGTGTKIGTVWYCHAKNRISNGSHNMGSYGSTKSIFHGVSQLPTPYSSGGCRDCYTGPPTHHETDGTDWVHACSGACPTYISGSTQMFLHFY